MKILICFIILNQSLHTWKLIYLGKCQWEEYEREREREKWNRFNTNFVLLGSPSLLSQTCSSSNQLKVKLPCLMADRGQHLGKFPFSLLTLPLDTPVIFKCWNHASLPHTSLSATAEQRIQTKIYFKYKHNSSNTGEGFVSSLFKADFIPVSTSAYGSLIHIIMGFNIWAG